MEETMGKALNAFAAAAAPMAAVLVDAGQVQAGQSRAACRHMALTNPLYRHHPGSGCGRRCAAAVRRCMAGEISAVTGR
jgi:hypothetical protein